ncbi:hypothetical protein DFJ74DRAFT_681876 [Hyaloraphidium curvatum]|nr:hypothetical protein DFJ74DRAFT_681876 [Hyaloraphidium curvatum]
MPEIRLGGLAYRVAWLVSAGFGEPEALLAESVIAVENQVLERPTAARALAVLLEPQEQLDPAREQAAFRVLVVTVLHLALLVFGAGDEQALRDRLLFPRRRVRDVLQLLRPLLGGLGLPGRQLLRGRRGTLRVVPLLVVGLLRLLLGKLLGVM